ncbi:MAG: mandelate racemase/muconate lactonizing enzyme family protein [Chloroflexota bacterium]
MRIAEVESLLLNGAHFVRITTEQGQVGLGQSACWAYPAAVDAVVQTFRGYLLGQDPRQIERHWQHLYRMGPFRGSVLSGAISAVDIALWDIKGQIYQAPIWDLLGGKYRDRVRLHLLMGGRTPEEVAANARTAAEEGFTAIKFDPIPDGFGDMTQDALVRGVVANVAAAREAVHSDVDIILELHRKLTPLQAPPVIEAVAQFNPLFVEDPVQIDSIVSQAEIALRVTQPIANGERMHTIWEFREMLVHGGSQYVRPDVGLAGGLTHVRKIAAIAESFHSAVVTHNFLGPVLTAAAVHLDTAIPNFVVQEYARTDETDKWRGFSGVLKRQGGYLLPPEVPGLGLRLVDTAIGEPLGPLGNRPQWEIPLRSDGSVVYAV